MLSPNAPKSLNFWTNISRKQCVQIEKHLKIQEKSATRENLTLLVAFNKTLPNINVIYVTKVSY